MLAIFQRGLCQFHFHFRLIADCKHFIGRINIHAFWENGVRRP